jgi:FtsH-binding integral membrane protein
MFTLDMLRSLAWPALILWLIMVPVVTHDRVKTNTPETDRTFLGFMVVAGVLLVFGTVTLAVLSTGLLQIAMIIFGIVALRTMLIISVKYLKARKEQPRVKTPS